MSRLMSVAFTEQAVVERRKTVTRRNGWTFLKPGDRLTLCRKVMGRKPDEPLVRLAEVEVVNVRREALDDLIWDTNEPDGRSRYGYREMELEGFPELDPGDFVKTYFVEAQGISPFAEVTRIEWRYLDQVEPRGDMWQATCDHGAELWYVERGTRYLARRSLNAHLRYVHGIEPARFPE